MIYENATVNGVPSYSIMGFGAPGLLFAGGVYVTTTERRIWYEFLAHFDQARQTEARLRRRLKYGGRKGRSAARRLRAMGVDV